MSQSETDFLKLLVRPNILTIRPYKPGKPIDEVQRELGLQDVVKMASNENPLGPSPKAAAAVESYASSLHLYPDGSCFRLRQELSQRFMVPPENILVGNGSCEIIELVARVLLGPEDQVVFADPSFIMYKIVAAACNADARTVPLKNYAHDLEAMANAIGPNTKLVYIANPNNPTGTLVGQEQIDTFMAQVPHQTVVVMDEAYYEYKVGTPFPDTMKFLSQGRNIVILRTFSKIYGLAGLRIGYGFAPDWLVDCINRIRRPFNVNAVAQIAAVAALSDEEHVRKSQQTNQAGKEFLYRQFSRMGLEFVPTEANFILVDVGRDATQVFQKLLKLGIVVRPMPGWGYPTKLRVTIGTQDQNERLVNALARVLA